MENKLSYIRVNDIFDELIDENERLRECLNVLFRFKTFIDLISDKLKTNLDSNDSQKFEELNKEIQDILGRNQMNVLTRNKWQHMCDIRHNFANNSVKSLQTVTKTETKINVCEKMIKSSKRKRRQVISPPINGLYSCDFIGCGAVLNNRKSFSYHRSLHTNEVKTYFCDFSGCDFSSRLKSDYTNHMNVHKGIRPFECQICNKSFHSNKGLSKHKNYSHKTSDEIIVCPFDGCNKEFNIKARYLVHRRNCHEMDKSRFACHHEDCQFKGISKCALKVHLQTVHSSERPFHCTFDGCNKTFKSNSNLTEHMTSHNTERNFKCEFEDCKSSFKALKDLRYHQLNQHFRQEMACDWPGCDYTTKNRKRLASHKVLHSTERNFPCNWPQCNKRFKTNNHLKIHLRIHTCDKRYACPWPGCHYRCTDAGNLVKHRKQVHEKK